ncbi:MAG: hypothetical protein AVDCRST_MAG76-199, partial [uncultured Acidimicrobiales bacterium]
CRRARWTPAAGAERPWSVPGVGRRAARPRVLRADLSGRRGRRVPSPAPVRLGLPAARHLRAAWRWSRRSAPGGFRSGARPTGGPSAAPSPPDSLP